MTKSFKPKTQIEAQHIQWLERFDSHHMRNWINLYHNERDAAICEAEFRAMLDDCRVSVEPNADPLGQLRKPDFRCHSCDSKFYVEVTCLLPQTAQRRTGIPVSVGNNTEPWTVHPLNVAIVNKCQEKVRQCEGLDAPCLLAIGTLHLGVSCLLVEKEHIEELLTGPEKYRFYYDPQTCEYSNGPQAIVRFRTAPFTRILSQQIDHMRKPISALLIAGFGCRPAPVFGILHPKPARAFDPATLASVPFCSLNIDMARMVVSTHWTQSVPTE